MAGDLSELDGFTIDRNGNWSRVLGRVTRPRRKASIRLHWRFLAVESDIKHFLCTSVDNCVIVN